METTNLLYKIFLDWRQSLKDSFYYFHQDRLQEKYREMYVKWNDLSRLCYELKQHAYPACFEDSDNRELCKACWRRSVVKKYRKAYAKAQNLRIALEELKKEQEKLR